MKRHRFDALSLVFGVAFVILAVVLSVDVVDIKGESLRWLGAGMLLLFGVLMLATSRSSRSDRSEP